MDREDKVEEEMGADRRERLEVEYQQKHKEEVI